VDISVFKYVCILFCLLACSGNTALIERGAGSVPLSTPSKTILPSPSPVVNIPISKWDLWTRGETLLRGANISQGMVTMDIDGPTFKGPGPIGPPFTQSDFDRLALLGANYVSISGPGIYSIEPPYELLPDVVAYYEDVLGMIAAADMFASIGFRSGPGRSDWGICCADEEWAQPYLNDRVWLDLDAQLAWSDMWRYGANRFKNNPVVVGYLLMVEPNPAAIHFDIYEAEEFFPIYAGSSYDWNSFNADIVKSIRTVDTHTPILIGGMNFSSVAWLPYLEAVPAERIVYVVDQYAPFSFTHQSETDPVPYPGRVDTNYDGQIDDFNRAWLEDLLEPVDEFSAAHNAPITVDEFGVVRWAPGGAAFLRDQMILFEARGMNYAIWEWASSWKEYNQVVNAFNFRFGPEPYNTHDQPNDMQDVIIDFWGQNFLTPSNVSWKDE